MEAKTKHNITKNELNDTENRWVVARGWGRRTEMGEGGTKAEISSYKRNESWECYVQHDDYS